MNITGAKLEIIELVSRYLRCLDRRKFDADSFAEVFTESAEVIMPSNLVSGRECKGLQEIRDVHAALFRQTKATFHASSDYIFESLTEENAEVHCKFLVCYDSFSIEVGNTLAFCEVNISAALTEKGWRIRRLTRTLGHFYGLKDRVKNK